MEDFLRVIILLIPVNFTASILNHHFAMTVSSQSNFHKQLFIKVVELLSVLYMGISEVLFYTLS